MQTPFTQLTFDEPGDRNGLNNLEEGIEKVYFLIQKGLIARTPRGRKATRMAYQHLKIKNQNFEIQQNLF